jgi:hypothetical protein
VDVQHRNDGPQNAFIAILDMTSESTTLHVMSKNDAAIF